MNRIRLFSYYKLEFRETPFVHDNFTHLYEIMHSSVTYCDIFLQSA